MPEGLEGRRGRCQPVRLRSALHGSGGISTGPHPALSGTAVVPLALPCTYTVRLTVEGKTFTEPLVVNPEVKTSEAALARQFALVMQIRNRLNDLITTTNEIHALRDRLATFLKKMGPRIRGLMCGANFGREGCGY